MSELCITVINFILIIIRPVTLTLSLSLPPFLLSLSPCSDNHYQLVASTADMTPEKQYHLSLCFSSIYFNSVSQTTYSRTYSRLR